MILKKAERVDDMRQYWQLKIEGMTCLQCEAKVERVIKQVLAKSNLEQVSVNVRYGTEEALIEFEANDNIFESRLYLEIEKALEQSGYAASGLKQMDGVKNNQKGKFDAYGFIGVILIFLGLYYLVDHYIGFNFIPDVSQNASYAMLFAVGIMTSVHCISMCGGINLSQCIVTTIEPIQQKKSPIKYKSSFLYNAGRVTSYTFIGGLVGALGSVVSLSGKASGLIAMFAGGFMILMGLNMLSLFPTLRKWMPQLPRFKSVSKLEKLSVNRPYLVGLINGFMPCGPLQTMQIFALGTGSAIAGALSMFAFSLGTVPLMFVFGAVSSSLSKKFTDKMLKVSAVLVIVLGIIMFGRGLSLGGSVVSYAVSSDFVISELKGGVQYVNTTLESGSYPSIVIEKGTPVRWVMDADASSINGCNNRINIPFAGISNYRFVAGENVIEFTPVESGSFGYSCWMGMISGQIKVVDRLDDMDLDFLKKENTFIMPRPSNSGGCCAP
jgi:sulfite exporter TauE/SafE